MAETDDFRERYTSKLYKKAYEEEFATDTRVTARSIFKKSEEDIANELVRLALHAESERTRLSAGTTIVEHLIGKPKSNDSEGDALFEALERIKAMPAPTAHTTQQYKTTAAHEPDAKIPTFKPKSFKSQAEDND